MSEINQSFDKLTTVQKLKLIESQLNEHVRPMLIMDGGDMEIIDLKEDGDKLLLFIEYLGACNGCPSSSTGTLMAIQQFLNTRVSDRIEVVPAQFKDMDIP
ncbi:MAG: NifU family protein [Brevinemataceae bacterium]